MYIHETAEWPIFKWDRSKIDAKLIKVSKAVGFLEGQLSAIGFDMQQQLKH